MRSQNLTDGVLPTWRHGRAWAGKWRAEWCVLYHPRLAISLQAGGYNDNEIQLDVSLLLFTLYVSREFHRCFEERELGLIWHDGVAWLKLWCDGDWHRDRPWHRNTIAFHVQDWFMGKPRYQEEKGEPVEVLIPMPEGCYRATATPSKRTWTWRFGFTKVRDEWSIDIDGGIPFSGKGENSWDCGDDGLYGTGGDTLEEAIGNCVAYVLKRRHRHGHDSKGTGRLPIKICNPLEQAS